jgi:hypothetical protein
MGKWLPRLVGICVCLVGLLAGVGPCALRLGEPPTPTPEVFNPLPPELRAFEATREALAGQLGLDRLAIALVEATPMDWPDTCLGLPSAGTDCRQATTPGFRVIVETGGTSYEFRTSRDARLVLPVAN